MPNTQPAIMNSESGNSTTKWLVVVAIVGAIGYFTYSHFKKPSATSVTYRTDTIVRGDLVQSVTANGSLVPVRLVEVGSQISGVITELKADFNSHVKEGDVIAQIDPATYERSVVQVEAELANAEAARELGKLNFDQAHELMKNSLITQSEFDAARVSLVQAEATVKTRQANVERAKVDLSRTTIYAPMDGIIISRKVESGQTVAASMNAPTLFVLANDLTKMQIEAAVSEADVGGVEEGQRVLFDVDAFPGRKFSGMVNQVRFAPTTNQNVITYTTVVSVDNKDLKLRPGMTANARIVTSERPGALKIPNAALRFRPPQGAIISGASGADEQSPGGHGGNRGGGLGAMPGAAPAGGPTTATVYVVESESETMSVESSTLRPVTVKLGISDGSKTELLDGLKEGDVVAVGTMTLTDDPTARNPLNPFNRRR